MKATFEQSLEPQTHVCSATLATPDRVCTKPVNFVCSNGHYICRMHALRLGGETRRRKTDVKCKPCMEQRLTSTVKAIDRPSIPVERRG